MTKPIVSVAAMMLVEEGRLGLHEPVFKFIPEFKDMKVAGEVKDTSTAHPLLRKNSAVAIHFLEPCVPVRGLRKSGPEYANSPVRDLALCVHQRTG